MENQDENKELLKMEEITKSITTLTKFEVTEEELKKRVAEASKIDISDLALVKKTRLELRDIEISIEKRGKSVRDILNGKNKEIISLENKLKEITGPQIEVFKQIEAEAERKRLYEEQKARLPGRLERLKAAGIEIFPESPDRVSTEELILEMTGSEFEGYINAQLALKNEEERKKLAAERLKQEEEARKIREAEEAKLAEERKQIEAEKAAARAEAEKAQKEADEKLAAERKAFAEAKAAEDARINAENARLAEEAKKLEDERLKLKHEEEVRAAAEAAKKAAEEEAKRKALAEAEAKKVAEEEERKRLEKEEKMRPDREKIQKYVESLEAVPIPDVVNQEAQELVQNFIAAWRGIVNTYLVK